MEQKEMNVVEAQETREEKAPVVKMEEKHSGLEAVNRLQCISQDVMDADRMIPKQGYELRLRLIEEAKDVDLSEKLKESYRNDDHALDQQRRAAEIANSVRSNKTKCVVGICFGVGFLTLARPVGKAFVSLIRRKAS